MTGPRLRASNPDVRPRAIARWLLIVAVLVFAMVVIGGITRLTESGLSITEWQLVTGVLLPVTEVQWLAEFEKYKQIPEYREINRGMSLAEFQFIYFWEWLHRLIGRIIGLAYALPLAWFAFRRAIPVGYGGRLVALLALGAFQGAVGWWMVQSGLSVRTDVSHYRLAVHLLTALLILAGLIWTALDLLGRARHPGSWPARMHGFAIAVTVVLFVQLLLGAYTAGLNAGYVSNSWPLMNERFVPDGIDWSRGVFSTLSSDPFLVHFLHRWWALVVVVALVMLARRVRATGHRPASIAIHAALGIQILLGIATVLTGMNFTLAVLHQAVGALVVTSTAWGLHIIGRQAIR